MHKTTAIIIGTAMLASTALLANVAPAAEKASERGVIAIIKPGAKGIGDPNTKGIGDPNQKSIGDPGIKPGETGTLPYIEQRKTPKRLNPPPEPDLAGPGNMPAWARDAMGNVGGGGGGGGGGGR